MNAHNKPKRAHSVNVMHRSGVVVTRRGRQKSTKKTTVSRSQSSVELNVARWTAEVEQQRRIQQRVRGEPGGVGGGTPPPPSRVRAYKVGQGLLYYSKIYINNSSKREKDSVVWSWV